LLIGGSVLSTVGVGLTIAGTAGLARNKAPGNLTWGGGLSPRGAQLSLRARF